MIRTHCAEVLPLNGADALNLVAVIAMVLSILAAGGLVVSMWKLTGSFTRLIIARGTIILLFSITVLGFLIVWAFVASLPGDLGAGTDGSGLPCGGG